MAAITVNAGKIEKPEDADAKRKAMSTKELWKCGAEGMKCMAEYYRRQANDAALLGDAQITSTGMSIDHHVAAQHENLNRQQRELANFNQPSMTRPPIPKAYANTPTEESPDEHSESFSDDSRLATNPGTTKQPAVQSKVQDFKPKASDMGKRTTTQPEAMASSRLTLTYRNRKEGP